MGDNISRKAAEDAIAEKVFHDLTDEFYGVMQVLDELPSTYRKGQWIFEERKRLDDETDEGPVYRVEKRWKCSVCGHDKGFGGKPLDKFCSECGADMRGADDE